MKDDIRDILWALYQAAGLGLVVFILCAVALWPVWLCLYLIWGIN